MLAWASVSCLGIRTADESVVADKVYSTTVSFKLVITACVVAVNSLGLYTITCGGCSGWSTYVLLIPYLLGVSVSLLLFEHRLCLLYIMSNAPVGWKRRLRRGLVASTFLYPAVLPLLHNSRDGLLVAPYFLGTAFLHFTACNAVYSIRFMADCNEPVASRRMVLAHSAHGVITSLLLVFLSVLPFAGLPVELQHINVGICATAALIAACVMLTTNSVSRCTPRSSAVEYAGPASASSQRIILRV